MSTRSVIMRKMAEGQEPEGVYHHWDGYPTALGATLWKLAHEQDLPSLLRLIIDEHHMGWSTLNVGLEQADCYCHARGEDPDNRRPLMKLSQASGCGAEWAYIFDGQNNMMSVLCSYSEDGSKMVGAFGVGDPYGEWKELMCIPLGSPVEPDWSAAQELASAGY